MSATLRKESTAVHLLGGGFAGLFSDLCVHPIDTIRARLQVQQHTSKTIYKSATDALIKIIRNEGPFALYKGFSAVAVGTIPGHALYFYGYELSKKYLNQWTGKTADTNVFVHLTSGVVADVFGSFAWTPMDVIKQRLQVQRKQGLVRYKGSLHALVSIVREDGVKGLFRGYWTGLATYAPYVALYFAGYEQLKILCSKIYKVSVYELPFYIYLGSAAIAATASAGVTVPLDVIKTRLQVKAPGEHYKNAFDAFRTIVRTEGYRTFLQGLGPRCLWMAGGTAITMVAYEECKKLLSQFL